MLISRLKNLPHKPGVYIFKGADGETLYIGKARDLKNRVSQYFRNGQDGRYQIPFLMKEARGLEHIVTDNEIESLFLESSLIKKRRPKYNIKLRDDKNYIFIKIDFSSEIPQIQTSRQTGEPQAKYFGPYSSAQKVREMLKAARNIFPYCSNSKAGSRPCFYYYLHKCPGVCIGKISLGEYQQTIKKIMMFLAGNIAPIRKVLQSQMRSAAERKQFEKAARLRDQIRSLGVMEEKQKAVFAKKTDSDFISFFQAADKSCVNVFVLRSGRLIDRKNFILESTANKSGAQILDAFLENYYGETSEDLPKEIYAQEKIGNGDAENAEILRKFLAAKKIKALRPLRGKKAGLISLGRENAREFFEGWLEETAGETARTAIALADLAKILSLANAPMRIECFDISNIQGTNAVAGMVVFEGGKPKKSEYRKFKMKTSGKPDDFAMMREALERRFGRSHAAPQTAQSGTWPLPDLLVIDGGKGQLGVAEQVLKNFNLRIPAIGLAKREEEIFTAGQNQALILPKSHYALQLLQRLRDEAHRFAITFHKKIRSAQAFKSELDEISGIGPKKKKLLLQKYGSIKKIREASHVELASLLGEKLARNLERGI